MQLSHWPTGDYPIFIDPTFPEILTLCKERWDTLRLCVDDDIFAVASGYGNTHQSIIDIVKRAEGLRRWHPETYIIFRDQGFFFNLEDVNGGRRVPWEQCKGYFHPEHWDVITEIINQSE